MIVKICGITCVEDALLAADGGADFIGLNFFEGSPRCVAPETARQIVQQLRKTVEPVALFVNMPVARIEELSRFVGFRAVQLHGDEPPESMAQLHDFFVIRAYRCSEERLAPLEQFLNECRRAGRMPDALLVDAHVPGKYGGTGTRPPWAMLARDYDRIRWPALMLAGGLAPENVAEAIRQVRPWGVDVASGVEYAETETAVVRDRALPRKNPEKVRDFIRAAREAEQHNVGR